MTGPVRVRYAPSPTGFPHVGNIRTALFNWLFARHSGGRFIVRIEDTDVARTVAGAVEAILDGLRWLNLDWDEGPEGGDHGPYFQSQRLPLYHEAAKRLVAQGNAYNCYCSPERLAAMRAEQASLKQPPGYDRHCRDLSETEGRRQADAGIPPVVRFKTPLSGETRFDDLLRGEVVFQHSTIDDFVILKSDGYPTYHLANVVDDHAMEISHVLRAEEWLSSTPRHLLMYQSFGYKPPLFAHMPMILGPDRSKLSKRHGAVAITEYRQMGFLPEAMLNYLALLGWAYDEKTELFNREELIRHFTIERIGKTPAIFNIEKLTWMNGVYIRRLTPDRFFEACRPFLERNEAAAQALAADERYVRSILPLIQDRARTLVEAVDLAQFFFIRDLDYDQDLLTPKNTARQQTANALEIALRKLKETDRFDAENLEGVFRPLTGEVGLTTGQFFGILRTATTGRTAAPPLFQTMAVLGKERCLARIEAAIGKLGKTTSA